VNLLQKEAPPAALSIAEFDPSGQSGTIADVKTFAAHNCYGVAAVTALTLPQLTGKPRFHSVASPWLKESILSVMQGQPVGAIKIGILCGRAGAEVVCEVLDANPSVPVVLDPDLRGFEDASGKEKAAIEVLRGLLVQRATVVTPNAAEAAALTGLHVQSAAEMKAAAAKLVEMGAQSVVVAGGVFEKPFDIYFDAELSETLSGERFKVEAPYGPGATFSSAIAANLALGRQPHDAVVMAKAFVTEALRKGYTTASGTVVLNHFYRTPQVPRVVAAESGISEPGS
jgi:hydroxymethylpyrimidine/phosphomethylpyrimidine kinase